MTGKGVRRAVVPPMGVADSLLPVFFEALHFAQARPKACSLRLSLFARPRLAIAGLFGQQKTCTAASFPPNFPRVSVFAWARPARRPLLALVDHHTVAGPSMPPIRIFLRALHRTANNGMAVFGYFRGMDLRPPARTCTPEMARMTAPSPRRGAGRRPGIDMPIYSCSTLGV